MLERLLTVTLTSGVVSRAERLSRVFSGACTHRLLRGSCQTSGMWLRVASGWLLSCIDSISGRLHVSSCWRRKSRLRRSSARTRSLQRTCRLQAVRMRLRASLCLRWRLFSLLRVERQLFRLHDRFDVGVFRRRSLRIQAFRLGSTCRCSRCADRFVTSLSVLSRLVAESRSALERSLAAVRLSSRVLCAHTAIRCFVLPFR